MQINTPGIGVGISGGVSTGISAPGINAGISTPGINAGIGVSNGVYGGVGVSAGIGGVGLGVKVHGPTLMIMGDGKINARSYRCNAITTIIFACLAPWGCISYVVSLRAAAVIMVIISVIVQVGLIVACCLALHMPHDRSSWKARRYFILIMCSIGTAFYIASIAVFISAIIYVKLMLNVISAGTLGADDADVVGTVTNIILYIVIALFVVDFGFKAPLIINAMLLGTKIFKLYK